MMFWLVEPRSDSNRVFSPCSDWRVQRSDGFTFGIVFAGRNSFFPDNNSSGVQLSPYDKRLSLSNSQLSVFRPKVDEISLLTINTTNFFPRDEPDQEGATKRTSLFLFGSDQDSYSGHMVAFAGRKYAARSVPAFVGNGTCAVTSFTLVLEFKKGRLQNLYWKRDECSKCSGSSNFVYLNNQGCAIKTNSCKNRGQGSVDCSLGIQLAFSGTEKHDSVFNSLYEVKNLRKYSLYGLYSNLKDSVTSQYNKFF